MKKLRHKASCPQSYNYRCSKSSITEWSHRSRAVVIMTDDFQNPSLVQRFL